MNKTINKFYTNIATLGPIGYLPAPGTCGSVFGFILFLILYFLKINFYLYILFLIFFTLLSWYIIKKALLNFKDADPSCIILDEVAACLYVFIGINISFKSIVLGFLLFRFFDISKVCGIALIEQKGGAFAVLFDDIGAAIFTNILLHLFQVYSLM